MRNLIYRLYERGLEAELRPQDLPQHVAVMLDGNRRWAKTNNTGGPASGHVAGAQKTLEFLGWCEELGIGVVTLYLLSVENLKNRNSDELTDLLGILGDLACSLADTGRWRLQLMGDRAQLPPDLLAKLTDAEERTAGNTGVHVNLAIGYGGRKEIADAMRSIVKQHADQGRGMDELAELLTPELIGEHLYTGGQPDPDLIIRTSGEQRLSGFLLWQSASSELYFEEALWPDFRKVDFLRALRAFQSRHRRFGA